MDVCLVIKQRLEELGLEQRDLAAAATVTESYISQLLTRKKLPPASDRTDIYDKMAKFLKLPAGKLSELADLERKEKWKRTLAEPPAPLLKDVRELILHKCSPERAKEVGAIFEKQPFGELERLVTQKLLDVAKKIAKEELENESWLRLVAQLIGRSYEQMRVMVLEFLDKDIFDLSIEDCDCFLDPLIESWDIDLLSFAVEIVLNRRLAPANRRRFEFVEKEEGRPSEEEPGFKRFVKDRVLSGDAVAEEIQFLKRLQFSDRRPTPLYYYRELQNLRDPLHFRPPLPQKGHTKRGSESPPERSAAPMHKFHEGKGIEKQLRLDGRKKAVQRWAENKTKSRKIK